MKDCKKIHPLLSSYLDKLLSPQERSRVEAHLKTCADARKELNQLSRLREVMVALPEPKIPQGLHDRIMARLKGHPLPHIPHRPFWVIPAGLLTAAAMVTLYLTIQNPGNLTFAPQSPAATPAQKEEKVLPNTSAGPLAQATKTQNAPSGSGYFNAQNVQTNQEGVNSNKDLGSQPVQKREALEPQSIEKPSKKKYAKAEISMDKTTLKPETSPEPSNDVLTENPMPGTAFSGSTTTVNQTEVAGGAPQSKELSSTPTDSEEVALPPAPTPTPLSSWAGSYNPSSSELQQVVTDAETFQKFWQTYQTDKPAPTVDFSTQAVVVLIDQERPTGGYSIGVSSLEEKPDQLVIHYKTQNPAPGSFNTQVLTRPWSLQVIPKPDKPVVFLKD